MTEMVFCRGCGKEIHKTARACPQCGAVQATSSGKNKVVAAVLAFFLGGFGAHRFYLGQWWGIFYLLLFWTLIPGVIALVETIVFLVTSDEKWDAKYNNGVPSAGSSGAVVALVVIVAGFGVIAMVGILAAIALPAYADYTVRAKIMQVVADGDRLSMAMSDKYLETKEIPASVDALGVQGPGSFVRKVEIDQQTGKLSLALALPNLEGKRLVFTPRKDDAKGFTWTCGSEEIEQKYLPLRCRQSQ